MMIIYLSNLTHFPAQNLRVIIKVGSFIYILHRSPCDYQTFQMLQCAGFSRTHSAHCNESKRVAQSDNQRRNF